jgi:hypothetical protein
VRYSVYAKLVVEFESDKTPAQIRTALVQQNPTLRNALKQAWRAQFAKDATGGTYATEWHFHAQGSQVGGGEVLDLDDGGLVDEPE